MTLLLALLGAVSYGVGDFCGGLVSRRVSAWTVAFVVQATGTLATAVAALVDGGRPGAADLVWAVLAGVANGVGTAALYRGLASGRMGVVAPISGVGAAVIPVLVGLAVGERPGPVAWVGIVVALPAIWLVSRQTGGGAGDVGTAGGLGPKAGLTSGLVDGVIAGVGFGTLFVALSRIGPDAGLVPLTLNQAVAGVTVAAVATALRQPWLPRRPRAAWGAVSGLLGALATLLFLIASRGGHLTVTAVVISLYPAVTVLLAAGVLRERVRAAQGVGLALCAASVVLVAIG